MGRLRQTLETIRTYLGSLSVSVKLLLAALCVVAVMSIVLAAQYSGKQQMTELLPGVVGEDQTRAKATLEKMQFPHTAQGGRVMVPSDKHEAALALLAENGKLPSDTSVLFTNLASKTTWMDSKSKQDFWNTRAIEGELAKVLGNFRGVQSAKVMISNPEPIGIGQSFRKPSAMVTLFMRSGRPLDRDLVDAAAALVAGAQAGLSMSDIKVIDGGNNRQYSARSPEDFRAGDYMEHKLKVEESVQGKVADFLRYIPGVIVGVNATVDVRRTATETVSALKRNEGTVTVPRKTTTKEKKDDSGTSGGIAPGFGANNTADLDRGRGGSGGAVHSSEDESTTEFTVLPGSKKETVSDPRGMPTSIAVAVNVPREYVEAIAKRRKGGAAAGAGGGGGGGAADKKDGELSEDEVNKAFDTEKARLEKDLAGLVRTAAADAGGGGGSGGATAPTSMVSVSMIPVPLVSVGGGGTAAAGLGGVVSGGEAGGGTVGALLGNGMIKNVALGVLAVGAIGAMLMLVKKAGQPVELPTAESIVGLPPALNSGDTDLVGEADESQTAMEGIELKDDEIKTKKLIEQVAEMVKKNPADAATLVNRWVQVED